MAETENDRVQIVRNAQEMTLEEFGKRIGVTKSAMGNIEKGRRGLTDQMCRSICREFNVSETWLRTGEGEMTDEAAQDDALTDELKKIMTAGNDDFRRRLIAALVRMPPENWRVLEDLAVEVMADPRNIAEQSPSTAPPPRNVHDMTRKELHDEVDRECDAEDADREKGTGESSTGSRSASGVG